MYENKVLSICEEFEFDAAHRLLLPYHTGETQLHGHTWSVRIYATAADISDVLGVRQEIIGVGEWIYANLDHAVIINTADKPLKDFAEAYAQKAFIMAGNSTPEQLAECLYNIVIDIAKFSPDKVVVDEGHGSIGEFWELND